MLELEVKPPIDPTFKPDPDTIVRVLDIINEEATRTKDKKLKTIAWRIFNKVNNIEGQPRHIDDAELLLMKALRNDKFSYGDLAFIFDRSRAAVHGRMKDCPSYEEILLRLEASE